MKNCIYVLGYFVLCSFIINPAQAQERTINVRKFSKENTIWERQNLAPTYSFSTIRDPHETVAENCQPCQLVLTTYQDKYQGQANALCTVIEKNVFCYRNKNLVEMVVRISPNLSNCYRESGSIDQHFNNSRKIIPQNQFTKDRKEQNGFLKPKEGPLLLVLGK